MLVQLGGAPGLPVEEESPRAWGGVRTVDVCTICKRLCRPIVEVGPLFWYNYSWQEPFRRVPLCGYCEDIIKDNIRRPVWI